MKLSEPKSLLHLHSSLHFTHKHTECLAPELCGLPSFDRLPAIGSKASCCGPDTSC